MAEPQSEIGNWLLDNLKVFNCFLMALYIRIIIVFFDILFSIFAAWLFELHIWSTCCSFLLLFQTEVNALLSVLSVFLSSCDLSLGFFDHSLISLLAPQFHKMCIWIIANIDDLLPNIDIRTIKLKVIFNHLNFGELWSFEWCIKISLLHIVFILEVLSNLGSRHVNLMCAFWLIEGCRNFRFTVAFVIYLTARATTMIKDITFIIFFIVVLFSDFFLLLSEDTVAPLVLLEVVPVAHLLLLWYLTILIAHWINDISDHLDVETGVHDCFFIGHQ